MRKDPARQPNSLRFLPLLASGMLMGACNIPTADADAGTGGSETQPELAEACQGSQITPTALPTELTDTDDGRFQLQSMATDPQTPDRGDNTWILRLQTMQGDALQGATVSAVPFMPDHGHGTTPESWTGTEQAEGEYEVGPFDLFMPGMWEVRLEVTDGEDSDALTVNVCVEG